MIPPMYLAQIIQQQMRGSATAIDSIKTPPIAVHNAEQIKATLKKHGCQIEEHDGYEVITFPPGTKRYRGLRVVVSELHGILLPDGYILHESYDTVRALSFLYFPREVPIMEGQTPTYQNLWYDKGYTLLDIWGSGTKLDDNALSLIWNHYPVSKEVAEQALKEYNELFHTDYTLDQVDIPLKETPPES